MYKRQIFTLMNEKEIIIIENNLKRVINFDLIGSILMIQTSIT